ncbi:unnamed protein product, partial [Iphiclides podalirius]
MVDKGLEAEHRVSCILVYYISVYMMMVGMISIYISKPYKWPVYRFSVDMGRCCSDKVGHGKVAESIPTLAHSLLMVLQSFYESPAQRHLDADCLQ